MKLWSILYLSELVDSVKTGLVLVSMVAFMAGLLDLCTVVEPKLMDLYYSPSFITGTLVVGTISALLAIVIPSSKVILVGLGIETLKEEGTAGKILELLHKKIDEELKGNKDGNI